MRAILGEHQPHDNELRQAYLLAQHYITNSTPLFLFNALHFTLLIHHKLTFDTTRASFAADDIFSEVQRIAATLPANYFNLKQQSCLTHRLSIILSNLPSHLYIDETQRHLPSWLLYNITNSATMTTNSILTAASIDIKNSGLTFSKYNENPLQTFWGINKGSFDTHPKIQYEIEYYFKIKSLHPKQHQIHINHCKIMQHILHQTSNLNDGDRLSSVIQDEQLAQETKFSASSLFTFMPHTPDQPKLIQQYFLKESLFLILFNLLNIYKRVASNTNSRLNKVLKKFLPFYKLKIELELFSTSFFIDSMALLKRAHARQPSIWTKAILQATPSNTAHLLREVKELIQKCRLLHTEIKFDRVQIPIEIGEYLDHIEKTLEELNNLEKKQAQPKQGINITPTTMQSSKDELMLIKIIQRQRQKLQLTTKLELPNDFNTLLQNTIESLRIVIKLSCDQYIFGHNQKKMLELWNPIEMTKAQINDLIENLKHQSQQTNRRYSIKEYQAILTEFHQSFKSCEALQQHYREYHYAIIHSRSQQLLSHYQQKGHITTITPADPPLSINKARESSQHQCKKNSVQILQKLLLQNKSFLLVSFILFTTFSIIAAKTSTYQSTNHTNLTLH